MDLISEIQSLSSSDSSDLHLNHSTNDECVKISKNTFGYLEESRFLRTIPLVKDNGMTSWILVDKSRPPNYRPILCSCETFNKHSLTSNPNGNVQKAIIHGIASVFCSEDYRGRGYAARLMRELATILRHWQSDSHEAKVVGSVLSSDIGKVYYAKLGWIPNLTNTHVEFPATEIPRSSLIRDILESELSELCKRDQLMTREAMATQTPGIPRRVVILPDLDHMLWHIRKENFATNHLFGKQAPVKGAITGPLGKQVWAVWTRRYYGPHDSESSTNVLYILRLAVEGDRSANQPLSINVKEVGLPKDQVVYFEAVFQAAQTEAAEWHLDHVQLWEPSACVQHVISSSNITHAVVERQDDSIASGLWIDADTDAGTQPVWISSEYYAWC
ncbi:hypothetical protein GGR55DRAFT_691912 [Xylaria sp. FL0064]|nr:hypothetical protein GGR55DRAFT_691912 [Xylaria sp. FL0064]